MPTKEGLAPDVAKSDFTNFIYTYYESSIDADAPEDNAINANLDYQRYYAPPLSSEVPAAVEKHFSDFERHWHDFSNQLSQMGLVTHG